MAANAMLKTIILYCRKVATTILLYAMSFQDYDGNHSSEGDSPLHLGTKGNPSLYQRPTSTTIGWGWPQL